MPALRPVLGSLVTGLLLAPALVVVAVLPLLLPAWMGPAQARAGALALTGWDRTELDRVTGAIVGDLVTGGGDFAVEASGAPVLGDDERRHMLDVRRLFAVAAAVAVVAAAGLVLVHRASRDRAAAWRRLGRGALLVAGVTVGLGALAAVAFDALFTLFHELLFPPGTWTFDPGTQRLVQLFPMGFWVETSVAAGVIVTGLALGLALAARRRAGGLA